MIQPSEAAVTTDLDDLAAKCDALGTALARRGVVEVAPNWNSLDIETAANAFACAAALRAQAALRKDQP